MFAAVSQNGIVARALAKNLFHLDTLNPRDFTTDNYRRIDDKTFGGGPGMVMKIVPLELTLAQAKLNQAQHGVKQPLVVYLSPPPSAK